MPSPVLSQPQSAEGAPVLMQSIMLDTLEGGCKTIAVVLLLLLLPIAAG